MSDTRRLNPALASDMADVRRILDVAYPEAVRRLALFEEGLDERYGDIVRVYGMDSPEELRWRKLLARDGE